MSLRWFASVCGALILVFSEISSAEDLKDIRWRNAARVFGMSVVPKGTGIEPKAQSKTSDVRRPKVRCPMSDSV